MKSGEEGQKNANCICRHSNTPPELYKKKQFVDI